MFNIRKLFSIVNIAVYFTFISLCLIPTPTTAAQNNIPNTSSTASSISGQMLLRQNQFSVFILLTQHNASQLARIKSTVQAQGGQVTHTFPYQAIIAKTPVDLSPYLASFSNIALVTSQPVELATTDVYGADARQYAHVWNSLINADTQPAADLLSAQHPDEPHHDAFNAPDVPVSDQLNSSATGSVPGYYQTSEYMTGAVAVGIIFLESNGQTDPSTENWTPDDRQQVFNELVAGLNWWAQLEPRANLSFVYDDHFTQPLPTDIEPINRPYSHQKYWIPDAMNALGYKTSDYFTQVRDYNNDLRTLYQTDWAFTIFVINSTADSDNRFSDNYFAYAYLGGPFMVLTSGVNGYGTHNLDAVTAHEMGHIFNALDQYYNAYQPCTRRAGYLYVENQNSQYGNCELNTTSIMRGQTYPYAAHAIDPYAAGQIGWRDSDGDDILDPLDTDLPIFIDALMQEDNTISVSGSAQILPYPSPNQSGITINQLINIQYRLNGDEWLATTPTDGLFDSLDEAYDFSATLTPGLYQLEVAAFDSAGNMSNVMASETIVILDTLEDELDTQLYPPASSLLPDQTITLDGLSYHRAHGVVASVQYRVGDGAWQTAVAQDGAFDSDYELFQLTINTLDPGTYPLEVFASDSDGNVEANRVLLSLQVSPPRSTTEIFLPLIIR